MTSSQKRFLRKAAEMDVIIHELLLDIDCRAATGITLCTSEQSLTPRQQKLLKKLKKYRMETKKYSLCYEYCDPWNGNKKRFYHKIKAPNNIIIIHCSGEVA